MPDDLPAEGLDDDLDVGASNEGAPALPEGVRRHLGLLLAAAYEQTIPEADAARFADLLARLDAAPGGAGRHVAPAFQADLLATMPALRRFAISLTHDAVAADDLVQDTLLRAWRSRGGFEPGTNVEAWTFTIMRNQFFSGHRKGGREVQDADGAQAARLPALPEQGGHLDLQDVRAALIHLAPTMREALMLVAVQDLSYEGAAAVMGCAVGTVKSRVWRARAQLARLVGYTGGEVGPDALLASAMEGAA